MKGVKGRKGKRERERERSHDGKIIPLAREKRNVNQPHDCVLQYVMSWYNGGVS
jgi:hypothetical protein